MLYSYSHIDLIAESTSHHAAIAPFLSQLNLGGFAADQTSVFHVAAADSSPWDAGIWSKDLQENQAMKNEHCPII